MTDGSRLVRYVEYALLVTQTRVLCFVGGHWRRRRMLYGEMWMLDVVCGVGRGTVVRTPVPYIRI